MEVFSSSSFIICEIIWIIVRCVVIFEPLWVAELARDALIGEGYDVLGGYMSPVNDAYGKKVSSGFLGLNTFDHF